MVVVHVFTIFVLQTLALIYKLWLRQRICLASHNSSEGRHKYYLLPSFVIEIQPWEAGGGGIEILEREEVVEGDRI